MGNLHMEKIISAIFIALSAVSCGMEQTELPLAESLPVTRKDTDTALYSYDVASTKLTQTELLPAIPADNILCNTYDLQPILTKYGYDSFIVLEQQLDFVEIVLLNSGVGICGDFFFKDSSLEFTSNEFSLDTKFLCVVDFLGVGRVVITQDASDNMAIKFTDIPTNTELMRLETVADPFYFGLGIYQQPLLISTKNVTEDGFIETVHAITAKDSQLVATEIFTTSYSGDTLENIVGEKLITASLSKDYFTVQTFAGGNFFDYTIPTKLINESTTKEKFNVVNSEFVYSEFFKNSDFTVGNIYTDDSPLETSIIITNEQNQFLLDGFSSLSKLNYIGNTDKADLIQIDNELLIIQDKKVGKIPNNNVYTATISNDTILAQDSSKIYQYIINTANFDLELEAFEKDIVTRTVKPMVTLVYQNDNYLYYSENSIYVDGFENGASPQGVLNVLWKYDKVNKSSSEMATGKYIMGEISVSGNQIILPYDNIVIEISDK